MEGSEVDRGRHGVLHVGSNRLEEAKAFYDVLLAVAGIVKHFEHPSSGRVHGKDGAFSFGVLGPFNKEPATAGNSAMVALKFETRVEVDLFHAKPLAQSRWHAKPLDLDGVKEGAPVGGPAFRMSYFRDLDVNKLCGFCVG